MQARFPTSTGLDSSQLINTSRLCCSKRWATRCRKRHAFTCQIDTPSRQQRPSVAMRDLPLPAGSDTAVSDKAFKQANTSRPAARGDNGRTYSGEGAARNNAARRSSGREASTSSPSSVTFQPPAQSSLARSNGVKAPGRQRMLDTNTYDVSTSVNEAAPGFTAASRQASASKKQRAEALIDAGQSESLSLQPCHRMVKWPPHLHSSFDCLQQSDLYRCICCSCICMNAISA